MKLLVVGVAAAFVSSPASAVHGSAKTAVLPLQHHRGITSAKELVSHARARFSYYGVDVESVEEFSDSCSSVPDAGSASGPAINTLVSYLAPVMIGGETYQLVVDTGSSNTWCGSQRPCEPSKTGTSTGKEVFVGYGSGYFSGIEFVDRVTYGNLTVKSQSIGSAITATGFRGSDGVFGLGPVALTEDTVAGAVNVPTFMDNLYKQGSISTEVLGVYFKPENGNDTHDNNGELTLGGIDHSKFNGSIRYFPRLSNKTAAAGNYWGLNIDSFTYGSNTLDTNVKAIIDTGTTLMIMSANTYNNFLNFSGGSIDPEHGLASWIGSSPTGNFNLIINSTVLSLTPSQYLIPQDEYEFLGLSSGIYYSWIVSSGTENSSGGGVDAIIGQKFLENYYSVYDTTNSRIGFAPRV